MAPPLGTGTNLEGNAEIDAATRAGRRDGLSRSWRSEGKALRTRETPREFRCRSASTLSGFSSNGPVPCEAGPPDRAPTLRRIPVGCCHRSDNRLSGSGPKPSSEPGALVPKQSVAVPPGSSRSSHRLASPSRALSRSSLLDPAAVGILRRRRRCTPKSANLPVGRAAARGQLGDAIAPVSATWPLRAGRLPAGPKRPVSLSRLGPGRPPGVSPVRRWQTYARAAGCASRNEG